MTAPDYVFYTDTYLGSTIPQTDFGTFALRGAEILTADICKTFVFDEKILIDAQKCVCAIAEILYTESISGGALKRESVGSWSRNYFEGASLRRKIRNAEEVYLGLSGLLYRGRCRACSSTL